MEAKGIEIWHEICDAMVSEGPSGQTLCSAKLSHYAMMVAALAAVADRKSDFRDLDAGVRVTRFPTMSEGIMYHFKDIDVVNRFFDRARHIIEAAKI